jgi:hypothetical protein
VRGVRTLWAVVVTGREAAVRYRISVVIPSSRFEVILVSVVAGSGCATGAGRS